MKNEDFKYLYDRLKEPSDIDSLSKELNLDRELLTVIYTQRTVRETTKKFYKVQRNGQRMVRSWQNGETILDISRRLEFPPILTGLMIFQESGRSKKQFWAIVRNPETIQDHDLREQIEEIAAADIIYSPEGSEKQTLRGKWGEKNLQDWLDAQGITYRTECDLRGVYSKTPDALLDKPIVVNGWKVNWIESKATFGDRVEVNKNTRKQLSPYVEMFGQGLVVYWFGFVDELTMEDGIYITDSSLTGLNCRSVE
ncbi:MAG TPA: C15orf41 family protein [Methanomassiliicoccales archaeon]|nr:C15orf41 family protein [Methanomassiliicoccales archaeon]